MTTSSIGSGEKTLPVGFGATLDTNGGPSTINDGEKVGFKNSRRGRKDGKNVSL